MERLSKSAFKLRSGNKPSPMELSGVKSPMKSNHKIPAWSGESETTGSKSIQKGLKGFSNKQLINIIKRNAETSRYGMLPKGGEYTPNTKSLPILRDVRIASDSVRAAANELKLRGAFD